MTPDQDKGQLQKKAVFLFCRLTSEYRNPFRQTPFGLLLFWPHHIKGDLDRFLPGRHLRKHCMDANKRNKNNTDENRPVDASNKNLAANSDAVTMYR